MKFKEVILLYREDLHRTGYSRFRFLYDPLVSLLLFFRLSDCNNCFLRTPSKFMLKLLSYKTGVQLVCGTEMGGGEFV